MTRDRNGDVNRRRGLLRTEFWMVPGSAGSVYGKPGGRYMVPICRYDTNPWDGTGEVENTRHFRLWENPAPWDPEDFGADERGAGLV